MIITIDSFLSILIFSFLLLGAASATITNRTIDDTYGDSVTGAVPIYSPATGGTWAGNNCTGCFVQPSEAEAYKGTWTAATYNPDLGEISIEFSFTGTAIYIYFILANYVEYATTLTEADFTVDGSAAGSFTHNPSTSTDMEYNALVFSQSGLTQDEHTVKVSTSGRDYNVFVNFDYAVYTFEDTTSTQSSSTPIQTNTVTSTAGETTAPQTVTVITTSTFSSSSTAIATSASTVSKSPSGSTSSSNTTISGISSQSPPVTGITYTSDPSTTIYTGGATSPSSSSTNSSGVNDADTSNLSASSKPIGAIAGGVIGGVAAILLALVALFLCKRRKQRSTSNLLPDTRQATGPARFTGSSFGGNPPWGAMGSSYSFDPHTLVSASRPPPLTPNRGLIDNSSSSDYSSAPLVAATPIIPPSKGQQRREELQRQMQDMQNEIHTLNERRGSVGGSDSDGPEIGNMRAQMDAMRLQIDMLQANQEMPPRYTVV